MNLSRGQRFVTAAALTAVAVALVLLGSCGKPVQNRLPASRISAISEIAALTTPKGADPAVFETLKNELKRQLEARLAATGGKISSAIPAGDAGRVTDLFRNSVTFLLEWSYKNSGDYDGNGEVGVSDITPIALNYGAVTDDGLGNNALEAWIDGDGNGEVGVSDITPIALNFLGSIDHYQIFSGPSRDGPWTDESGPIPFSNKLPGYPIRFEGAAGAFPGEYAMVQPFDADGNPGEMSNVISLSGIGNPIADITADFTSGTAPLTVSFDGSGSSDANGSIVRYEWDFEGDGVFELNTGAISTAEHAYNAQGSFFATLRVVDDDGASAVAGAWINVAAEGNTMPNATLSTDVVNGKTPLTVSFDASASSDPDGAITLFEWDYDGDGSFDEDTGTTPSSTHEYVLAGTFNATVRITDNGNAMNTSTVVISASENLPPVAGFEVIPVAENPYAFSFAALTSNDPDGTIVSYQWDWEFDGTFTPDFDGGTLNEATHSYPDNGAYTCALRVRDDNDAIAEVTQDVVVDAPALIWNEVMPRILPSGVGVITSPALAPISGTSGVVPALAYNEYNEFVGDIIYYIAATDATGVSWGSPVEAVFAGGSSIDLQEVNGNPAIAWESIGNHLAFLRADDSDGASWTATSWESGSFGTGRWASMAIAAAGFPVIASYNWSDKKPYFSRATDAYGNTWGPDILLDDAAENGHYISMSIVDGFPAAAYYDFTNGDLRYVAADSTDGASWGAPLTAYSNDNVGSYCSMTTLGTTPPVPAIACIDYSSLRIMYIRASDRDGSSWSEPITIEGNFPSGPMALALVNGKPAIAYTANIGATTPQVCYRYAFDAEGSTWSGRHLVHSATCDSVNLIDIGGHPAVAFVDTGVDTPGMWYAYSPGTA